MSGHSATRGLPGRRNGSKTSSRSTLQQASVALVAFSMGSVFAFLILRPSTPPPPAEHEAFSLAARSQLMLGQITSLQRQLSIRDAELVQLRSLPTELEKIPNPADITLEARLAVKPEDGLIQATGEFQIIAILFMLVTRCILPFFCMYLNRWVQLSRTCPWFPPRMLTWVQNLRALTFCARGLLQGAIVWRCGARESFVRTTGTLQCRAFARS